MEPKDWIAVASVMISIFAVAISWGIARRSARTSVRPVMVFEYSPGEGWKANNVGEGPALNIIIAQQEKSTGTWLNPVRVPPVPMGGSIKLTWCLHDNLHGLGVLYEDADGRKYTTTCRRDLSQIHMGYTFGPWDEENIGKHWAGGKIAPPVN